MTQLLQLPIDASLPDVVAAARAGGVVVVAPPGSGKTTRVPSALLDALGGDIIVLEPRRLAARLSAARVASERAVKLGDEVGYEVRLDRAVSAATRLRFVTEGILTRRLQAEPLLPGVRAVVLDEFHERHLDGDLALALLLRARAQRVQQVPRQPLALVVMSATLAADQLAAHLGAPIVRAEGRMFPITIEYAGPPADEPSGLSVAVRGAVRSALPRTTGDILVFLPGTHEIRRVDEALAPVAATHGLSVVALHGELTPAEQDRALGPASSRKVILATNVAETSLTIPGVTVVIDSGLARIARTSPWTGIGSLSVEPIAKASAEQRAGRAGRTAPGLAIRLFDAHDFGTRRPFDAPEILRADLSALLLGSASIGIRPSRIATDLPWLDAPPGPATISATTLLTQLGALADDQLTPLGRRMARFAAHPRAARLLCEAEDRGCVEAAAVAAALLGARDVRTARRRTGPAHLASRSDVADDVDAILAARHARFAGDTLRRHELDGASARWVDQMARQFAAACQPQRAAAADRRSDEALMRCIAVAFVDRLGRRRGQSAEIVFASGSGQLAPSSSVVHDDLLVAVDAATTDRGRTLIRKASAVDPAWLIDSFADQIIEADELTWDRTRERVVRRQTLALAGLVFDEVVRTDLGDQRAGADAAQVLTGAALAIGLARFIDMDALSALRNRLQFAATYLPDAGLPDLSDTALQTALTTACAGLTSFAELERANVMNLLEATLAPHRAALERIAPTHLTLPNRRRVAIHYEAGTAPWVASRMQDFFGLAKAPSVAGGAVPLVLHLLAPNSRPVQVTADLPGFWVRHYPALRRELARKYPRHRWPDNPLDLIVE